MTAFKADPPPAAGLVGSWSLESWSELRPGAAPVHPLGPDAIGRILYTADGHMSAQIMRPHRPRLAVADWRAASEAERAGAWGDYFGYFGRYTVDAGRGTVVHHVEGAAFPNLVGADQVRRLRFEGDRLVLEGDIPGGIVRIVWRRPA